MIVKDGEGATKFVKIIVKGAESSGNDAFKVAETISNSNLVKTAIYGEDPNWGRIIAAAGRAGVTINLKKLILYLLLIIFLLLNKEFGRGKMLKKSCH